MSTSLSSKIICFLSTQEKQWHQVHILHLRSSTGNNICYSKCKVTILPHVLFSFIEGQRRAPLAQTQDHPQNIFCHSPNNLVLAFFPKSPISEYQLWNVTCADCVHHLTLMSCLIPSCLSTPDEAVFGDAFALILVFLSRETSQSSRLSIHFFPSVTRLALPQV